METAKYIVFSFLEMEIHLVVYLEMKQVLREMIEIESITIRW